MPPPSDETSLAPPNALAARLAGQRVLLLDGGLATELERRGATLDDALWSARLLLDDPGRILDVHRAFVAAGADVLTTASYQASVPGFARVSVPEPATRELMLRSVSLARLASEESGRDPPPLVAASVGSYGAFLPGGGEYRGRFGKDKRVYKDFHRPRLEALLRGEPDLFALETLPSVDEAEALVELLDELGAVGWLSFTCESAEATRGGDPLREAFTLAEGARAVIATGANCIDPLVAEPLLLEARRHTRKPLVIYPNSGERWDPARRRWTPPSCAVDLGALAQRWRTVGARLIGGCCRTTPEDIARVRTALAATGCTPPRCGS